MPHQCTSCGRAFADGSKEMLSGCPDCGGNKFQFMPEGAMDGHDGGSGQRAATAPKKAPEDAPPADADAPETGGTRREAGDARRDGPAGRGSAPPETQRDSRASAVDRAAATVRDWVGRGDDANGSSGGDANGSSRDDDANGSSPGDASTKSATVDGSATASPETAPEDSAQASARSDVVSESELPDDLPEAGPSIQRAPGPAPGSSSSDGDSQHSAEEYDEGNVVSAPDDENPGLKELREELNSQFESIRIVEPGQYELNLMELYEREEYIISLQEDGKYVIEVPDAWDSTE